MKKNKMSAPTRTRDKEATQPLRGWVNEFHVLRNGQKFGPYYARCWKQGNKTYKEYIKREDVENIRAACKRHRDKRAAQSACTRETNLLVGNLKYLHTLCRRETKGALRPEDHAFADRLEREGFSLPGRPSLRSQSPWPQASSPQPQASRPKPFMVPSATNFESGAPTPPLARYEEEEGSDRSPHADFQQIRHALFAATHRSGGGGSEINPTLNAPPSAPNSVHLPFTIYHLRSRIMLPLHRLRKSETPQEKWNRWLKEKSKQPSPRPNVRLAIPNWITQQEVDATVDCVAKLLRKLRDKQPPAIEKPTPPAIPQAPTRHPRNNQVVTNKPAQTESKIPASKSHCEVERAPYANLSNPSNWSNPIGNRQSEIGNSKEPSFADQLRRLKENN